MVNRMKKLSIILLIALVFTMFTACESKELDSTKGTGINVDYRLNQEKSYPFNTVSSISVTGKIIEFSSCEWLSKVSKLASNISFYPLTNGKIEYILTFHNSVITYSAKG